MAVSRESLESPGAVIIRFPMAGIARAAAARRRAIALRRTLVAVGLCVVLALVLLGGGHDSPGTLRSGAPRAVVMRPGQTLWDLATRYSPATMDPRAYMDDVLALNHLDAPPAAGVRVRLP